MEHPSFQRSVNPRRSTAINYVFADWTAAKCLIIEVLDQRLVSHLDYKDSILYLTLSSLIDVNYWRPLRFMCCQISNISFTIFYIIIIQIPEKYSIILLFNLSVQLKSWVIQLFIFYIKWNRYSVCRMDFSQITTFTNKINCNFIITCFASVKYANF